MDRAPIGEAGYQQVGERTQHGRIVERCGQGGGGSGDIAFAFVAPVLDGDVLPDVDRELWLASVVPHGVRAYGRPPLAARVPIAHPGDGARSRFATEHLSTGQGVGRKKV